MYTDTDSVTGHVQLLEIERRRDMHTRHSSGMISRNSMNCLLKSLAYVLVQYIQLSRY